MANDEVPRVETVMLPIAFVPAITYTLSVTKYVTSRNKLLV